MGGDGQPVPFYPYDKWKFRQEVVGFENRPLRLERVCHAFVRLQINTGFYLLLSTFKDYQQYHHLLSHKLRRKLRTLDDYFLEEQFQYIPARTATDFEDFLDIFKTQWPGDAWVNPLRPYLPKIYLRLEELGCNCSFLLRDRQGIAVAGLMMYRTRHAVNWHLLSRRRGMLDKYAPGIYLIHRALRHFFDAGQETTLIFGPGDYEWKHRFLGQPYPVYRYEALKLANWVGLAGLCKHYFREHPYATATEAAEKA